MKPYQQRVLAERDELADKVASLSDYLRGPLSSQSTPEEWIMLQSQLGYMNLYLATLNNRILIWTPVGID